MSFWISKFRKEVDKFPAMNLSLAKLVKGFG